MKISIRDRCARARVDPSIFKIRSLQPKYGTLFIALVLTLIGAAAVSAQTGDHTLFGDLTVDESKVAGLKPLTFDVIL